MDALVGPQPETGAAAPPFSPVSPPYDPAVERGGVSPLLDGAVLTPIQALGAQGAVVLVAVFGGRAVQLPVGEERSTWKQKQP